MRANANAIRQQPNLITAGNCRRRTRLIVAYDYAGIRSRSLSCFDFPLFSPSLFGSFEAAAEGTRESDHRARGHFPFASQEMKGKRRF